MVKQKNKKKTSRFTFFVKNIVKNCNFQKKYFSKKDVHLKKITQFKTSLQKTSKSDKWKNEKGFFKKTTF